MTKQIRKIEKKRVKTLLAKLDRSEDASKYDCGHTLICAGTFGMAGAAMMCGRAALRAGSGLVTYYAEREIIPLLQTGVPEAMCRDIEEDPVLVKFNCVAVGPGLVSEIGARRLKRIIVGHAGIVVIDAEGLNILARNNAVSDITTRSKKKMPTILTPHEGEAARLLGMDSKAVKADREGVAEQLQRITGATVVLKGRETLVATEKEMTVNPTGGPGMATAGSGDVLTGIIAAFASQGMKAAEAATAGVYIHGIAGDAAAKEFGVVSMCATDIVDKLPDAIMGIRK